MLRSWGFYTDGFARSWLFTSSLINLTVLVMPILAVLIAAAEGEISTGIVVLAAVGLVSATGIVLVWLMLHSEAFSRRIGTLAGRFARWVRGVVHRCPSEQDFAEAAVRFRDDLRQTWSERGGRVMSAVIAVLVWRFRRSWKVAPPESVGAAGVGAVITDREPPRAAPAGDGPSRPPPPADP
jgi:hypothetical protein